MSEGRAPKREGGRGGGEDSPFYRSREREDDIFRIGEGGSQVRTREYLRHPAAGRDSLGVGEPGRQFLRVPLAEHGRPGIVAEGKRTLFSRCFGYDSERAHPRKCLRLELAVPTLRPLG